MASQAHSDFNECMATLKTTMSTVGVWPFDDAGLWPTCKFLVPVLLMGFLIVVPQTTKAIVSRHDFMLMLEVISTIDITEFLAIVKMLTMLYYKFEMKSLLMQMQKDWETASVEELRKMQYYARVSKWLLRIMIFTVFTTVVIFDVDYLVKFNAKTVRLNDTIYRPLYLKSYFPFKTHESPIFEIIIVGQKIGASLSVFAFVAYDGIYGMTTLHYSGQFYNLKIRMRNLVQEHRLTGVSFTRCIKSVIQRHANLLSDADMIEETFNKTFLVKAVVLSILLCLHGYELIMLTSEGNLQPEALLFTIFFTVTSLNSMLIYCAIAQLIRDESLGLFDEIYQTQWYELPAKDALMIVIVMVRCARPIELTVSKFSALNLEYFAGVMKTVAGYMSMLLAVRDKIME